MEAIIEWFSSLLSQKQPVEILVGRFNHVMESSKDMRVVRFCEMFRYYSVTSQTPKSDSIRIPFPSTEEGLEVWLSILIEKLKDTNLQFYSTELWEMGSDKNSPYRKLNDWFLEEGELMDNPYWMFLNVNHIGIFVKELRTGTTTKEVKSNENTSKQTFYYVVKY